MFLSVACEAWVTFTFSLFLVSLLCSGLCTHGFLFPLLFSSSWVISTEFCLFDRSILFKRSSDYWNAFRYTSLGVFQCEVLEMMEMLHVLRATDVLAVFDHPVTFSVTTVFPLISWSFPWRGICGGLKWCEVTLFRVISWSPWEGASCSYRMSSLQMF